MNYRVLYNDREIRSPFGRFLSGLGACVIAAVVILVGLALLKLTIGLIVGALILGVFLMFAFIALKLGWVILRGLVRTFNGSLHSSI